jgi:mono/diheme cytochrome c family protein
MQAKRRKPEDDMKENYDRYVIVGLLLTLALVIGVGAAFAQEDSRLKEATIKLNKANVLHGRQLYVDNCTSCHGTRGEGIVGPALNNKTLLTKASDEVLFATIRTGRPNTVMPAWGQENGGPLTDEDIRYVVSFLRAWEPTAPEVTTTVIVVPSAARGAAIFAGSCFTCHGDEGQGTKTAPALNDAARLKKLDNEWYRQTIANGRPAKGMPTWGTVLSPNQIEDVVALLSAWRAGERVVPETTVAELLDSALFSLSQGDKEDAVFYLQRGKAIAFGPALTRFDPIIILIKNDNLNQGLTDLGNLRNEWPIGDAKNGAAIYSDSCKGCHGSDGQGGVGRKLKPNEFIQKSNNAEMLQLVLTGRAGTAMRSFSGRLTEAQLADVIAFLRTWQP